MKRGSDTKTGCGEDFLHSLKIPVGILAFCFIYHLFAPEPFFQTLQQNPGRPPICRKALLKCFFVKTVFQINSLRKLTRFLHQYPSFRVSCGLSLVPHISTFSRVG
ncbi:transposase, partial [Bacillus thuringiensis]|nr:transposase [Bacillus thuringiensis]